MLGGGGEREKLRIFHMLRLHDLLIAPPQTSVSVALVFTTTRRNEEELFKQTYFGSAARLKSGLEKGVSAKVKAASAFSKHYTGRFGGTGKWPNATIRNFEDHSIDLLNLARGRAIR